MQCAVLSVEQPTQPTQERSIINQRLATDQKSQQKSVKTITNSPMLSRLPIPSHSLLTEFRAALSFWPWVCWHGAAVLEQTQPGRVRAVATPKAEPRGLLHTRILRCHYSWVKGGVCQPTPRYLQNKHTVWPFQGFCVMFCSQWWWAAPASSLQDWWNEVVHSWICKETGKIFKGIFPLKAL